MTPYKFEQVLPFFQPGFTLTIDLVEVRLVKKEMFLWFWIVLLSKMIMKENFETRRALIYTLNFTAKTYMFGPHRR